MLAGLCVCGAQDCHFVVAVVAFVVVVVAVVAFVVVVVVVENDTGGDKR